MSNKRKSHTNAYYVGNSYGKSPKRGRHASVSKREFSKDSPLDKKVVSIPRSNGDLVLTRRTFLYGALGAGVLAGAGVAAKHFSDEKAAETTIETLSVPTTAVTESTSLAEQEFSNQLILSAELSLPYGTLIWSNSDNCAALLIPTSTGSPLTQVGYLNLESGYWYTVLTQAVGLSEGFEIYDVRASSAGLIWTEVDILEGIWRIYLAKLTDGNLDTPSIIDTGDADWETPSIAICGNRAFWQVMPKTTGTKTSESSQIKTCTIGNTAPSVVLESKRRMATALYALDQAIVATPRADSSSVYYQLTLINATTLEIDDSVTLPQSMKPLEAGYGNCGFTFSFEGIYSYGDGISNLGTYTPSSTVLNSDYDNARWFHFSRTPSAPPCWCGNYFVVKSTKSVVCCDLSDNTYFYFSVASGAADYGDYLGSTGCRKRIVTFTSVNDTPINGSATTYTQARIWSTYDA